MPCSCAASSASAICRRDRPDVGQRQRPLRDPIGERRPWHELEHERVHGTAVFEAVDMTDVRMIERREHLRFTPETGEVVVPRLCSRRPCACQRRRSGIQSERFRQDFDRDVAIQLRVARLVDLAHAARANARIEAVWADPLALEVLRHRGLVEPHGRRLEKAFRAPSKISFRRRSSEGSVTRPESYSPDPLLPWEKHIRRPSRGSARPALSGFRAATLPSTFPLRPL